MAMTDASDGRAIMTCDKQADQEFFEDPCTTLERVASGSTCQELVDAHRKLAMTTEGRMARVEDPVEAHAMILRRVGPATARDEPGPRSRRPLDLPQAGFDPRSHSANVGSLVSLVTVWTTCSR